MKKSILIGSMCVVLTTVGLCGCETESSVIEQVQEKVDPQTIKNRAMEKVLEDEDIVIYANFDNTLYDKSILMVGKTSKIDSLITPSQEIAYYVYDPQNSEYVQVEGLKSGSGQGFAGSGHGTYLLDSEGNLYRYEISGGTGLYNYDKLDMKDGEYKFVPFFSGSKAEEQQKNLPPADEDIAKNFTVLKFQANTTNPDKVSEEVKKKEEQAGNQIATVTLRYVNSQEIQTLLEGKDVSLDAQYNPTEQYYLIAIFPNDYKIPGQNDGKMPHMYVLNSVSESHDYFKKYLPLDYLNGRQVALSYNPMEIGDSTNTTGVVAPIQTLSDAKIL